MKNDSVKYTDGYTQTSAEYTYKYINIGVCSEDGEVNFMAGMRCKEFFVEAIPRVFFGKYKSSFEVVETELKDNFYTKINTHSLNLINIESILMLLNNVEKNLGIEFSTFIKECTIEEFTYETQSKIGYIFKHSSDWLKYPIYTHLLYSLIRMGSFYDGTPIEEYFTKKYFIDLIEKTNNNKIDYLVYHNDIDYIENINLLSTNPLEEWNNWNEFKNPKGIFDKDLLFKSTGFNFFNRIPILVYGTLRKGGYNYDRFLDNFGEKEFRYYSSFYTFSQYKMFDLGSYPGITKHEKHSELNPILLDRIYVSRRVLRSLIMMEEGAGYTTNIDADYQHFWTFDNENITKDLEILNKYTQNSNGFDYIQYTKNKEKELIHE
jgi:gamma-glutamylcyclotransferase (GGCT)/AIG2-like uncharacterized protein YtfP